LNLHRQQYLPYHFFSSMKRKTWLMLLPVFLWASLAQAQKNSGSSQSGDNKGKLPKPVVPLDGEKPLIHVDSLASDKRPKEPKKKKIPKRMFYGIKTRKAYTRVKKGKNYTFELFYVLKKPQDPMPFVKDIYWFHKKKRKIFVGPIPPKDQPFAKIMHGPYLKQVNRDIVEQGIFYLGAKHGRWMYEKPVGEEPILQDKLKFYKGFPKESEISYFDVDKKKLQEVRPVEDGKYHGQYFRFFEDGTIAEEGKYEQGKKIGMWIEYFQSSKKLIKKQTQHAKDWTIEDFEPYVVREYNDKGRVTYDKATEDKKKAAEEAKKPAKN
jgi:hypothetical protein